jgi:hypothetical protein
MGSVVRATAISVAGVGVVLLWRRSKQKRPADGEARSRWRTVTVHADPEDVMPGGQPPAPFADLGDRVEVEVSVAPGGKGTELRARLRAAEPTGVAATVLRLSGKDLRQELRSALREAKQLIEVGEVLRVDPTPHGHRTHTPQGKLIEAATKLTGGEGVL